MKKSAEAALRIKETCAAGLMRGEFGDVDAELSVQVPRGVGTAETQQGTSGEGIESGGAIHFPDENKERKVARRDFF
jgi:hypothetical protein